MKKAISSLLACCLLAASASASELDHHNSYDWYAVPSFGLIKSDQSRVAPDFTQSEGNSIGLDIGKRINDYLNLELGYSRNIYDITGSNDTEAQNVLDLDALLFPTRQNEKFALFFSGGIGVAGDFSSFDGNNPTISGGVGFLTNLGLMDKANFRFEAKFQQEIDSSDWAHDDLLVRAGVQIPFGSEKVMPKAEPKDSDGDGVLDADDRCPGTPLGIAVNEYGCELDSDGDGVVNSKDQCPNTPAGTRVDAKGCKLVLDSDGDGVNDDADRCPNTPAGTAVNAYGCALDPDDDNDGVPNSKDQCPNTAAGVRVDFKGCEIKDVITLPGINFELNSAQLTADSIAILDGAASTLNTYTDINAEVAGHTDSTGSAAYNMGLSDRRAASVKNYLVSKGVAAGRLTSRGYGEEQPIADNSTKAGRAQNRRVELRVKK